MVRILLFIIVPFSYYLGRFKSDWVYTLLDLDMAADPDRIAGVMVTMAIGAGTPFLLLLLVVGCMSLRAPLKSGSEEQGK